MRNRMVLAIAAATALLAGCGGNGSTSTTTTTPAAPTSATGTMAEAPSAPRDATAKRGTASGDAGLTVTNIRIGRQPGFDRVVYDLGGKGTPGWIVQYADRAVQDGSGKPIDVAGTSILEVQILGSTYPFDSAVPAYAGPDPATDPSAPAIAGVYRTTVFEGTTQSFIGVHADRPGFTVSTLTNPTRLVIDVATQ